MKLHNLCRHPFPPFRHTCSAVQPLPHSFCIHDSKPVQRADGVRPAKRRVDPAQIQRGCHAFLAQIKRSSSENLTRLQRGSSVDLTYIQHPRSHRGSAPAGDMGGQGWNHDGQSVENAASQRGRRRSLKDAQAVRPLFLVPAGQDYSADSSTTSSSRYFSSMSSSV